MNLDSGELCWICVLVQDYGEIGWKDVIGPQKWTTGDAINNLQNYTTETTLATRCMWCICTRSPPDMWSYRWKCLIISGRGHQDRPSSVSLPENNVEKPSSLAWNNCPSVSVPSKITHRRQFRNIVHVSSSFGSGIPLHMLEELKSRLKKVLAHSFLLKHFSSCSTFLSFSFLTKYSNLLTFLFKIIF